MNRGIRRSHGLTRREREIMDVLHQLEKATVADVLRVPESTCTYTLFTRVEKTWIANQVVLNSKGVSFKSLDVA